MWDAAIGEDLPCVRELSNSVHNYAVAIVKDSQIVGHIPKKISMICSIFIRRGGGVRCQVLGPRQFTEDLPQSGLEVPCSIKF